MYNVCIVHVYILCICILRERERDGERERESVYSTTTCDGCFTQTNIDTDTGSRRAHQACTLDVTGRSPSQRASHLASLSWVLQIFAMLGICFIVDRNIIRGLYQHKHIIRILSAESRCQQVLAERNEIITCGGCKGCYTLRRWGATWFYIRRFARDIFKQTCNTSPPQGLASKAGGSSHSNSACAPHSLSRGARDVERPSVATTSPEIVQPHGRSPCRG